MSFYDCRKCGHTVHEDDYDHGRSDQCLDCLRAENEKRIAELRARVEAMAEPELAAFWRKLEKIGDSPEDMAFAAGYAEGLAKQAAAQAEKERENAGAVLGGTFCFRGAEARAEALTQGIESWCDVTQWRHYFDGITVAKVDGAWVVVLGPHGEPVRWRNMTLQKRTKLQPSQLDELVDYSFERLEDPDKEGGKP